jgi:hypothetical protein
MTSDGGGLLLREVDERLGVLDRLAGCFTDYRNPNSIEHSVQSLVAQRVYGLALGKEMEEARTAHERTGKPARRFRDFRYRTCKSWSCERRVVGKAEYLPNKANPRFVVTGELSQSTRYGCSRLGRQRSFGVISWLRFMPQQAYS